MTLLDEIYTASTLSCWTYFLTIRSFWVASWVCCFLKSPSLNFNHMVSVFGIISSHWCWTLRFLLLNSCCYYYYKFLGMMGKAASPFKVSTSSTWNSPLQIKTFQSKNVAFLRILSLEITQCCTGEFYISVSEFTFSCHWSVKFHFIFHISFTLLSMFFSRRPYCINFQNDWLFLWVFFVTSYGFLCAHGNIPARNGDLGDYFHYN